MADYSSNGLALRKLTRRAFIILHSGRMFSFPASICL